MKKSNSTLKNIVILGIAILVLILVALLPLSESVRTIDNGYLDQSGQMAIAVLVFALILWISEALPFHITGLISVILLTVFRIDSFKSIINLGFGNDVIVFFIGVLIMSAFITKSGLGRRISMFILSVTGNNTKMILLGFIISGAFIAMWVTEMAAAAMLMPLAKSLLEEEDIKPLESNFGKALMIACAWGPVIGGASTPAGSGSNSLAIGFIRDMTGVTLSFVDWMAYGVPVMLVMIIPTWLTISLFFKPEMKHLKISNEEIRRRYKELPKLDHNQRVSIALFILTIALWTLSPFLEKIMGIEIPISMPVILTATLFFVPGMSTIPWKEIEKDISWSGIILVVTGISLGMVLYNSGAAMWVSVAMLGRVATMTALYQIFAVVLLISLLKVIFSSNTVTGTIIIPIMITLAQSVGINPLAIGIPAAITSSLAFILVTSSPTNLIPYSAGYFSIKDMAKAGLVLTLVGSVLIAVVIYLVGHGQGLY